ncbi:MAG: efflux RND transporter permease subunit, partial [Pseudomonadota bacterium]
GVLGVAAVKVSGGLDEEIQITVDQQKLAQLNLSIADIAAKVRAENVNLSGGRLEQGSQRYLVRTVNEFESVSELANSIVSSVDGRALYLKDIATIERGYKDREAITRVNGVEAVELAIYKEGDGNTVQVASRVKSELNFVKKSMGDTLSLTVVQDQSEFIQKSINEVVYAAMYGGLFAILVLYGFLRSARATWVIGLTIPVSIIGTFALMHLSNLSLNIMSLGGIALAIGLLVDNSIVVLENIVRKQEQGEGILNASRKGAGEVSGAVIAATLTTVAVFFPMVFVSGIAGQLFKDQALTVTYALLFSLLLALVLIPMLASMGGRKAFQEAVDDKPPGRVGIEFGVMISGIRFVVRLVGKILGKVMTPIVWLFQSINAGLARLYRPLLRWALRHRLVVVGIALGLFGLTAMLVPRLGTELIPQLAQGEFSVNLRLAPGSPLASTDEAIQAVWRKTSDIDSIDATYSVAGTGNRIDASPVDAGEHAGSLTVQLKDSAGSSAEAQVMREIRQGIASVPGATADFSRPELLNLSTPLEVVVHGFDLEQLRIVSADVSRRLIANDRFTDVRSSIEGGNPEIQIYFDQERAAALGIATRDIADRVVSNVRGDLATRYSWRDTKIDVTVRSVDSRDASISEIRELIVNPSSTRPVSLDDVARIEVATGPAEIKRIDQERVAIISANLAYGDLGAATVIAEEIIGDVALPVDMNIEVLGQSEEMNESLTSMQFTMLLAVFLVYLVMASQFESLLHPFVIMLTVPLALIGAVGALFVAGMTINVVAFIGAIMLVGIVVNNAIVLIDTINQLRASGEKIYNAITHAAEARLRPILMTTLTTALGLAPMAIGFGEGSEVRAPMAITVIGGLLTSTLLTLLVIPAVYSLFDREKTIPDRQVLGS